jgi:hypothetical protein
MRRRTGLAGAALALATTLGTAPGALAADSVYGGSTSATEPIVVNADKAGKKLRSAVVAWRADCADDQGYFSNGSTLTPTSGAPGFSPGPRDLLTTRNGKRRFSGRQEVGFDLGDHVAVVVVKFDGRLGAKAASGTLSADVSIVERTSGNQVATCKTGRLRWKASRAPGRVFGGKTSQDQPVVARLDAKRKRVTDLLVSWEPSSCQPEGGFHFWERLSNFGVKSSGRFSDSWDSTEPISDGGSARTTYALTGRVSRRTARGTMRFGVTWLDAAGATQRSCDSGGLTWKATTG